MQVIIIQIIDQQHHQEQKYFYNVIEIILPMIMINMFKMITNYNFHHIQINKITKY